MTRRLDPEEHELERKKLELAAAENELADRELDLNTLQAELRAFESRYLRSIGVLYAEIDEIEAQIAEESARRSPRDTRAKEEASQARTRAQESAQAASNAKDSSRDDSFRPAESIKKLYRDLAKQAHPDLATNEADRAVRTTFMAKVNVAYQNGDGGSVQSLFNEWHASPHAVTGEGIGADLVRIIRKLAQVRDRLDRIASAMTELHNSALYGLMMEAREAAREGRNLLEEMAAQLSEQITQARRRLARTLRKRA